MADPLDIFYNTTIAYGMPDPYGNLDADTWQTTKAWVERGDKLTRNRDGAEVISTAQVFCPAGTPINATHLVRLRHEQEPREVIATKSYEPSGLPLPDHVEVLLV